MKRIFQLAKPEGDVQVIPVRASSNPRPIIIAGLLVIAISIVGFGAWAAWVPLARGAHVVGQIVVDSSRKTIQHFEGGIVKEIRVQEGSRVNQGDVLLVLDETQALSSFKILTSRRVQEQVLEARLIAERDGARRIAWPQELASFANDPQVQAVVADQQALFEARRREMDGQIRAMSERVAQLRRQAEALTRQLEAQREQARLTSADVQAQKELQQKGFVSANRVRDFEREAARLKAEHAAREAEVAEVEAAIQATELQIIQTRQGFTRQVVTELQLSRARVAEVHQQVASAADIKARTTITAPVGGQVIGLSVHTVGGVVPPGRPILDIVPENDRLIVEARVRPVDADVVHADLPAEIRFSSLPPRQSPLLKGRVISVSSDTLSDAATRESYYLARIEVREGELAKLRNLTVVPGMPVEVLISSGERTLLDYLVAPIQALFERAMRED